MVAVLLVVIAVGGWLWLRHGASGHGAAGTCVEGPTMLAVTVDPDVQAPVRAAADRYNASKTVVRDHCANVAVTVAPSAAVADAFVSGNWDPNLGPQPALWIPNSSRSVEAMRVPGLIQGTPTPVTATPVVLAVPDPLRQALESAKISWSDLPRLQQGSLGDIGLAAWGGLRMAMPPGDDTLAAALAVGSAVSGADPLTDATAHAGQVTAAISRLVAGAPQTSDEPAALTSLSGAGDANAPVHAVPTTAVQAHATSGLSVFRPSGSAPVDDYPAALLTGSWVDKTQNLTAELFADYLRKPAQQKLFAEAGFATDLSAATPAPARSVLDQIRSVLANPIVGMQSTVLIDTSAAMASRDGTLTRLGNTLGAVQSTVDTMPPEFGLGVWTYSDNSSGNDYQVQTDTAALTPAHRSELAKSLSTVAPDSVRNDVCFAALEAAYRSAVKGYATGRTNTVLLITGGPNDTSSVSANQLVSDISAAGDTSHPVRIDVIVVGGTGSPSLEKISQQTGGTYTRLATSDDLAFGTAVNKALTTP